MHALKFGPVATPIDYTNTVDMYANSNSPDLFELTPKYYKKNKSSSSIQYSVGSVERYCPYSTNEVKTPDEHIKYGTYKPMEWTKEVS